jgi:hypothetical protein
LPRHFSFGAFNRDWVAREEGLSMLVLEGRGATDADAFRATGIGDYELYEFERYGKRPDGTAVKLAFALALASDPRAPRIGFFTCSQRYPKNFWNPAFQCHANRRWPLVASYSSRKRRVITQNFLQLSLVRTVAGHRMA